MKKNILIVLLLSASICFAQNKKEQIEQLTFQVDSLKKELKILSENLSIKTQNEKDLMIEVDKVKRGTIVLEDEMENLKKNNFEINAKIKKELEEKQNEISNLLVADKKSKDELNKIALDLQLANDIVELTNLLNLIYSWHCFNPLGEFQGGHLLENKDLYIGVDWKAIEALAKEYKATDFFTDDFISNINKIALNIDLDLKKSSPIERKVDGISKWQADYDIWSYTQDTDCGSKIVNNLLIENNNASFYWIIMKELDENNKEKIYKYNVTAKKIGENWKINSLEGFDVKNWNYK
jgi:hypothetical protein